MVDLFLVFLGTSILFSIMVILIYIPTNSVWEFLSLRILASICEILSFAENGYWKTLDIERLVPRVLSHM
jgi:hypothetical protein